MRKKGFFHSKSLSLSALSLLLTSVFGLTGCQTTFNHNTGVFRNREFDYLHQPISHRPPLVIPQGVDTPTFTPKNTLPTGPESYPAESSVDMTPPGFTQQVPIPGEKKSNPVANKTTTSKDLQTQIQSLQDQIETLKSKTPAAPSTHLVRTFTSRLKFDSNNVGLLKIDAPFQASWQAVENAVQESGYTLEKIDKGSQILYVTAAKTNAPHGEAQHFLLFVNRKDNSTQVSVFTDKGVLDNSEGASNLLTQLQAKLSPVGN